MTFVLPRRARRLVNVQQNNVQQNNVQQNNVQQNNVQQKPCASQKDQACPKQRHVQA